MNVNRNAITIFDDETSMTLVKPYSLEYENMLFVIYEDAYGEAEGYLTPITELRSKVSMNDYEFDKIIKSL